jgi:hypothetical protein
LKFKKGNIKKKKETSKGTPKKEGSIYIMILFKKKPIQNKEERDIKI